ncbi:MAG: 4Fe-4S dicluster domain-containing protein, partial [Eggerthellaceae bacterium]|nr:4Fe-4S dicluster domain-containing protein [Eggerthellaceae bacterium]
MSNNMEQEARGAVSRRALCIGVGSTVALLGLGALKLVPAEACVRPPGGQDEGELLARCTHCNRCVGAC